jgi:hypothetical protein
MVSAEIAAAVVQAVESALAEAGLSDPYRHGERVFQWLERNREMIEAIRSREALTALIRNVPEEAEQYLPVAVALIQIAPSILTGEVMRMVHQSAADNPVSVPPGRPVVVLADSTKDEICDSVSDLHRKGVPLTLAKERSAERFGVSTRSVERVWRQRDKLAERKPQTIADLFEAFQRLGRT